MNVAPLRNDLGVGFVVAIAGVFFLITMAIWSQLQPLENLSIDFRMRRRLSWVHQDKRTDTKDLVLLAIDETTETQIGRYGSGRWLSRGPFLDQLRFIDSYCSPSVVAYDIIFKDTQGSLLRSAPRVSDSTNRTGRIARELTQLSASRVDSVSDGVLSDLSQLALEQGNIMLAHGFAETWEKGDLLPLLGFNFRGGKADPQSISISMWSDFNRPGEEHGQGRGLPYLLDVAIPSNAIHFVSEAARDAFPFAPNASLPSPDLWDYAYMGSLNIPRDADGFVRRVPLVMGFSYRSGDDRTVRRAYVPSFALLAVLLHLGVDTFPIEDGVLDVTFGKELAIRVGDELFQIPIDGWGRMQLNYRWRQADFSELSFSRLAPDPTLTSDADRQELAKAWGGLLRDRIAVIGVTMTGVDVGPTPINANMPLVYVQLTAINNIVRRAWLVPVTESMRWGIMITLLVVLIAVCLCIRSARVVLASLLLLLVYASVAYGGLHVCQVALPLVAPSFFLVTSTFCVLTLRYFTESRARRRIRGMFSTMVSESVLSFLEDHPESFSLEGHTTDATVLFSDISEFTTLSEHLPPSDLIQLLNMYLTPVTDCVLKCGGYLDKYVGDSVMAVWGAPYADAGHALKACLSALEQQRIVAQLNDEIESIYGFRLSVRIGVNSGEVTAGNVGSERKFQYTVLGDPVNLASRLEPANREFGTGIVIGEATQRLVGKQLETREIGRVQVIGREQVVSVYELLGERDAIPPEMLTLRDQYAVALDLFYNRDWEGCRKQLESILAGASDGPSEFLLARSLQYANTPPPDDWQGVYVRVAKD